MNKMKIRFDEVIVGDLVYDTRYSAYDQWREVTEVSPSGQDTIALALGVSAMGWIDTRTKLYGHKAEGITVIREGA